MPDDDLQRRAERAREEMRRLPPPARREEITEQRLTDVETAIVAVSAASKGRAATAARGLEWMLGTMLVVGAILIVIVFWQSYAGRVNVIEAQRAGCLRSTLDRIDEARDDASRAMTEHGTLAATSRAAAVSLMSRTGLGTPASMRAILAVEPHARTALAAQVRFCLRAFPDTSPWPWAQ